MTSKTPYYKISRRPKKRRQVNTTSLADVEREPMSLLVCGETGMGKTHRSRIEINQYLNHNEWTGRKGRKVLVFDANDDDYPMFRSVPVNHIHNLHAISPRRIRPITQQGRIMTDIEKRDVVEQMIHRFRNGLLVFEDLDKYMVGAKGQSIVSLLTTNRHSGLDIMITHQSIAKITTTEWQSCTWLRLHHQVDDIKRYRDRIPNFFLVCIASFIVDEQYELANLAFQQGWIDLEEYKKRKSYYCYVDMRRLKIRGVSRHAFIRATKRYIDRYERDQVKMMLQETNLYDDKPVYQNRTQTVIALIERYLRHHEANPVLVF